MIHLWRRRRVQHPNITYKMTDSELIIPHMNLVWDFVLFVNLGYIHKPVSKGVRRQAATVPIRSTAQYSARPPGTSATITPAGYFMWREKQGRHYVYRHSLALQENAKGIFHFHTPLGLGEVDLAILKKKTF